MTMPLASRCFCRLLLLAAVSNATINAQSTKAELFGAVRDPDGLPVERRNRGTRYVANDVRSSVETDAEEAYNFFALP